MQPRLLFVTSSFRTRWEVYSQALIHASGLASRVLLLDGRSGWHPLNFVERALALESDFIVHIDEDCFLLDPAQLVALVADLAAAPELAGAGVPDGGTPYRSHNPHACNLFFCVFKTEALRQAVARRPDWRSLRFDPAWAADPGPVSVLEAPERVARDDFEPYYPLFWLLLAQGFRIHYLRSQLDRELWASEVFHGGATRPMAIHAWHLRNWFSPTVDPILGIAPAEKYRRIGRRLQMLRRQNPRLWGYCSMAWLRLICGRLRRGRAA